ncbi:YchJ family protein [Crenobacter cavernae]|uniref:YchJ family protein n=1 Tax=Crenobacter cavernae TaxID=2290923 RepID=UPI001FEC6056|nr:YchJ family protein [Crenobacter cavernae]
MKKLVATSCPCGSGRAYATCCGVYHQGAAAPTAEALMRSRYSAYALGLEAYLLASWHPDTRPERFDLAEDAGRLKWIGLEIKATGQGREADGVGTVEFVARYKVGGRAERMSETSRFERVAGRWVYRDGDVNDE